MTLLQEIKARVAELPEGIEAKVSAAVSAVRERWPDAPSPGPEFAELVVAKLSPNLRIEDLFLAWWCGTGDPSAISRFEAMFGADLLVAAKRFRDFPADELVQNLRIKLFVGTPDSPPKIREYSGTGSLQSWLRVTAVRSFIDLQRATRNQRQEEELDENELLGIATPQAKTMRAEIGQALKQAFAAAVGTLSARQRVFLRHAYVDHHTLDQIAMHYGVHRTTVARTLAAARTHLVTETRAAMASAVGADELTSVIRALDTQIELSLSRVLDVTSDHDA